MKRGAFDYVTKPFKNEKVLVVVRNAAERRRLVTENRTQRESLRAQSHQFSDIIGRSRRMRQVFELIAQAAPSRTTILVQGESGTGKELAARALHDNSTRADRPFVTVNSGSLPPDLLESHLFGHPQGRVHRGDRTQEGAVRDRRQGHHLLRRDRECAARDAGEAVAGDAGAGVHAVGRCPYPQGGCAYHRGHQRRPEEHGRGRPLPRGSVLPAPRDQSGAAAAP